MDLTQTQVGLKCCPRIKACGRLIFFIHLEIVPNLRLFVCHLLSGCFCCSQFWNPTHYFTSWPHGAVSVLIMYAKWHGVMNYIFLLKPRCKELASNIFQITCEIVFNLKLIHVHYIHRIKALLNLLSPQWCYTYWLFSFILNKFKLNLLYKKSKSPQFFQPMDFRTSKSLNRVTKQIFPISVKNSLCR